MTDKPSFDDLAAYGAQLEREAQDWHITAFVRVNTLPDGTAAFGFDLWRFVPTLDTTPADHWQLQVNDTGCWCFVWNDVTTQWSEHPLQAGAVYELSAGWDRTGLACTLARQFTTTWEQARVPLETRPTAVPAQPTPTLDITIQDYAVFNRALSPEQVQRMFSAAQPE